MSYLSPFQLYQPAMDSWRPGFTPPSMGYPGASILNPYAAYGAMPPLPAMGAMPMTPGFWPGVNPLPSIPSVLPVSPMTSGIPAPAELAPSLWRAASAAPSALQAGPGAPYQSFQNNYYNNLQPAPMAASLGTPQPMSQPVLPPAPPQQPTPPALTPQNIAQSPAANEPKSGQKALEKAMAEEQKNRPTGLTDEVIHSLNDRLNDVANVENRRTASMELYNILEANPGIAEDPQYRPYVHAFLYKILKDPDSLVHVGALLAMQLHKVQDISPDIAERMKELEHAGGMFKQEDSWVHQALDTVHVVSPEEQASHKHPSPETGEKPLEAAPEEMAAPAPSQMEATSQEPQNPLANSLKPPAFPGQQTMAQMDFPASVKAPGLQSMGKPMDRPIPSPLQQPMSLPMPPGQQLNLSSEVNQLQPSPMSMTPPPAGRQLNVVSGGAHA